ncbi:MAG: DUF2934 domain-containing protein [Betaproteobacteria bacterium]|nr:MAG: DUF2934 domain-containing protein [Betaproteobacteria bacterium]TMH08050.1 MAG: DUF2934 domain-containing protein [Betaproteobacteria bacterium]
MRVTTQLSRHVVCLHQITRVDDAGGKMREDDRAFSRSGTPPGRTKKAPQAPSNVTDRESPADLLPPGLRGAPTSATQTQTPEQSKAPSQVGIDAETRHRMIREAAYRLYARRGYLEGFELDDWLQAEAEVDGQLGNRSEE